MILSHKQIEEIAAAVTKDFNEFFFGKEADEVRIARATPIDQLAKDYLGLNVSFARLSSDGSICGLTAYADTEYITEEMGIKRTIPLRRNQVLLDESFMKPGQVRQLCGKRRFTLAHECAHQILFQMESDEVKDACEKKYGRMIEIYLLTSLAPIPVATLSNRELGNTGQNYLKSLFAVGFQGLLILVCVAIYAVLIQGIATSGDPIGAIWGCMGYSVLLCFCLFKTGSIARSVFSAH